MAAILNCILYHINNKVDKITIFSQKLINLPIIDQIVPTIIKIINQMKKEIPEPIRENINKANLKEKYPEVLKYYIQ